MRQDVDKFIEYVLAQVGEGTHSKGEVIEDLKERGLSEEEIDYVMQNAWSIGNELEGEQKKFGIIQICIGFLIPIVVIFFIWINGGNIFSSRSFFFILMGFAFIIYILFKKRKFN